MPLLEPKKYHFINIRLWRQCALTVGFHYNQFGGMVLVCWDGTMNTFKENSTSFITYYLNTYFFIFPCCTNSSGLALNFLSHLSDIVLHNWSFVYRFHNARKINMFTNMIDFAHSPTSYFKLWFLATKNNSERNVSWSEYICYFVNENTLLWNWLHDNFGVLIAWM